MLVLHAAELANRQTFAGGLQFLVADIFTLASLAAFGGSFMGGCHGPVFGDVFPGFLVGFSCYGKRSCLHKQDEGQECFLHKLLQVGVEEKEII